MGKVKNTNPSISSNRYVLTEFIALKGSRTQSTTTKLEIVNVMVAKAERKIEMDYA